MTKRMKKNLVFALTMAAGLVLSPMTSDVQATAPISAAGIKSVMRQVEKREKLPANLLSAIATVESAWQPWAIYAKVGKKPTTNFFKTKQKAIAHIRKLQRMGVRNINIGYMQINLRDHQKEFKSIEQALEPKHNIEFAVRLLKWLKARLGSWQLAVRHYNTSRDKYNVKYWGKVSTAWQKINKKEGRGLPVQKAVIRKYKAKNNISFKSITTKGVNAKVETHSKTMNLDGQIQFGNQAAPALPMGLVPLPRPEVS